MSASSDYKNLGGAATTPPTSKVSGADVLILQSSEPAACGGKAEASRFVREVEAFRPLHDRHCGHEISPAGRLSGKGAALLHARTALRRRSTHGPPRGALAAGLAPRVFPTLRRTLKEGP